MLNIWSSNRYLNLCINILVFMVGINFMHIGQLILPIICFLLFVENKLHFKVNSPKIFIILCLFSISFYAFSYKLGFYSVMGFTLPMAYYIGSNIKNPSQENIKKVIYLLALSMSLHVVLNACIELALHGTRGLFFASTHYDFWTRDKISNTGTAVNADLLIGCIYYVLNKEDNKRLRIISILVFLISFSYLIIIGRRTTLLISIITYLLLYIYEKNTIGITEKHKRMMIRIMVICACIVIPFAIVYYFDLFSAKTFLDQLNVILKLKNSLIGDERIRLYFDAIKLMPKYPFGGQKISGVLGLPVHELWLDVYDYAGIIPYILIVVFSLYFVFVLYRYVKNKTIDNDLKLMVLGVYITIIIQMFLEPVMTGASLFLLITVIIHGIVEKALIETPSN